MSHVDIKEYEKAVVDCLWTLQMVEMSLKLSIKQFHGIITEKVEDLFPYNPPLKSIETAAMGRLIEFYKQFSDDNALIQDLKNLTKMRNEIAHGAFLVHSEYIDTFPKDALDKVSEANELAQTCMIALVDEHVQTHKDNKDA